MRRPVSGASLRASGVLLLLIAAVIALVSADAPSRRGTSMVIGVPFVLGALTLGLGIRKRPYAVPGRIREGWSRRNAVIGLVGAVLAPLTLWAMSSVEWLPLPKAVTVFALLGAPVSMLVLVSYELSCVRCRRRLLVAQVSHGDRLWYCQGCRAVALSETADVARVHVDAAAAQVIQAHVAQAGRGRP